jgi:PadR family transcriptional regulator AphA
MSSLRLTETSYIVLGLLEKAQPATPYDLKQLAQMSTANFWSVPHTQLYTECARLAKEGLLSEQREQTGRRRRIYRLTDSGRQALERWRSEPARDIYELRDVATLKLFVGADPAKLAAAQVEVHEQRLQSCEALLANLADAPRGWRLTLECGIGHEREFIRFWSQLAETGTDWGDTRSARIPKSASAEGECLPASVEGETA